MPPGGSSGSERSNYLMGGQNRRHVCSQRKHYAPCASVCGIYAAVERSSMELHGHVAEGSWGVLGIHYTQRHSLSSVYVLVSIHICFFLVAVAVDNKLSVVVRGWERCQSARVTPFFFSTSCTTTCDTLGNRTPPRPQTSTSMSSGTRLGGFISLLLFQLFVLVAQTLFFSVWWCTGDSSPKKEASTYLFQQACLLWCHRLYW